MPPRKRSALKEKQVLTSDQRKALNDAGTIMAQAYADARKKLSDVGFKRNQEGSTACLAPPSGHCKFFVPPQQGPAIRCARRGCGHSFFRHDVF